RTRDFGPSPMLTSTEPETIRKAAFPSSPSAMIVSPALKVCFCIVPPRQMSDARYQKIMPTGDSIARHPSSEMRPLIHPVLVNGRFGDPAVFVETLFERRAVLFDLGDIAALPARNVLKVDQVFVSHTHLDHFFGFDRLLRLLVGREKSVALYGPGGFLAQVHHKLQAYQWNLVHRYSDDLVFLAHELVAPGVLRRARFRLKTAFASEELGEVPLNGDVLHEEARYRVRV